MIGWVLLGVLLAIAVAAPRYGADSRGGVAVARATVRGDLVALARRLLRSSGPG